MKPITHNYTTYSLAGDPPHRTLSVEGDTTGFEGTLQDGAYKCPLTPRNAKLLRERLPWLKPQPLGLAVSFGFGDRLGLATPGHIAAVQQTGVAPIFAQQSVRENARTGRTPQNVLDDAMWAVFDMDWRAPWGADADHVKEISDLASFIEAGYSFYTIDPNEYVDVDTKIEDLHWESLGTTTTELEDRYCRKHSTIGLFDVESLQGALLKYGRAIAHVKTISDYLIAELGKGNFDLEMSVDETDIPTTVKEHFFIANELRRLDVPFVSLAPRFIGSFEKGVDYIGNIDDFDRELGQHAVVMHAIGGYKLSIHTGSDKFSIYPSIARQAHNLVHVKTAGTSYLEALRVIAAVEPSTFRQILDFCRSRYESDRATYHVSGILEKVPSASSLGEGELADLFEQFDARQVLHVTFGSVLDVYSTRLKEILQENLSLYEKYLKVHFDRHLKPFTKNASIKDGQSSTD
jgi:hypothetical protein